MHTRAPACWMVIAGFGLGLGCNGSDGALVDAAVGGSGGAPAAGMGGASTAAGSDGTGSGLGSAGGGGAGSMASAGAGAGGAGAGGAGAGGAGDPPNYDELPGAGYAGGTCAIPLGAEVEDTSNPTEVVGDGTPASCSSDAFVSAVARGGIITFDCGPDPITIRLTSTAKIVNDTGPKIVIDGGGKVTLSGEDRVRILYQNTCDQAQKWTTEFCDNQDHPELTVQNLTFVRGNAMGQDLLGGGGAIFVRGGRFKILNSRFFNNHCDENGPDVGGAAVRVFDQFSNAPAYVVSSTFGGRADLGNVCSNGGALSSIGVSYSVVNSLFSHNLAVGRGANPERDGTEGGGSGGAIYNDGDEFTLSICGSLIEHNHANEGGGAVFFVSNDDTGSLVFRDSRLADNPSEGFETPPYKGVFVKTSVPVSVTNTTFE